MALYEYRCSKCGSDFDKFVSMHKVEIKIKCPTCGSARVKRKLSSFATMSASSGKASAPSACNSGGG